jgi:hypothetical protein
MTIRDNTAFDRTDLRFLYCTENSHEYISSRNLSNHHFIFVTPIRILLITNRKWRSLTPYSKLRRAYTVNIASQADTGQWKFHKRQNSVVHRTRVKQRKRPVKPEVATVSLARVVFGGDRRMKTETEWEQSNAGEFPKTLTPSASVHQYHACPWTRTYNSLYLLLNTFSLRPFLPVLEQIFIYDQISQISFFFVQRSIVRIFLFLLYKF